MVVVFKFKEGGELRVPYVSQEGIDSYIMSMKDVDTYYLEPYEEDQYGTYLENQFTPTKTSEVIKDLAGLLTDDDLPWTDYHEGAF